MLAFPGPGTYCYRVKLGTVDLLGSGSVAAGQDGGCSGHVVLVRGARRLGRGRYRSGERDEHGSVRARRASSSPRATTSTTPAPTPSTATSPRATSSSRSTSPRSGAGRSSRPRAITGSARTSRTCRTSRRRQPRRPRAGATARSRTAASRRCRGRIPTRARGTRSTGDRRASTCSRPRGPTTQGGYQGDFLAHWNGPVAGCAPCGAELPWLKADLAAHAGALKFAFFHYPLHSDSSSQPLGHVSSPARVGSRASSRTTTSASCSTGMRTTTSATSRRSRESRS